MADQVNFMTDEGRTALMKRLLAEQCSCIICKENEIRVFHERGVKDLYRLFKEEPLFLKDAFVVDKVVGKAAAALMILGGVKEVFAGIISLPAYKLFNRSPIDVRYTEMVPHIINRTKTDWCPLERSCSEALTAEACLPVIEEFIANLPKQKRKI